MFSKIKKNDISEFQGKFWDIGFYSFIIEFFFNLVFLIVQTIYKQKIFFFFIILKLLNSQIHMSSISYIKIKRFAKQRYGKKSGGICL